MISSLILIFMILLPAIYLLYQTIDTILTKKNISDFYFFWILAFVFIFDTVLNFYADFNPKYWAISFLLVAILMVKWIFNFYRRLSR
ncbi:MAG: hypothetical protein PF542_02060 [Nanoarchaeota archaeon]|jgi:divalent metal cation (Fe/Co/Zn/Cd) transporter|nr:hypothetical protein [Nanoarchaeota archaeon]